MSVADITTVLRNAQNADTSIRTQAELQLQQYQQQNLPGYLLSLATELADESKPADVRQIAGLIIKNALDAPSEARKVGMC
jgi:importin subunit beta-1